MTRGRGEHPLSVRSRVRARLGGPPDAEGKLRAALERRVAEFLRLGCERFGKTRQPETQARKISDLVRYVVARKEACELLELRVDYRNRTLNSPGRWKKWVEVVDGEDQALGTAGDAAGRWK